MARPKKSKKVSSKPECLDFIPLKNVCLDKISLDKEEFEAIRLKDFLGIEQKQAALKMETSQSTFHRILLAARKKIADALVNAKELKIKS